MHFDGLPFPFAESCTSSYPHPRIRGEDDTCLHPFCSLANRPDPIHAFLEIRPPCSLIRPCSARSTPRARATGTVCSRGRPYENPRAMVVEMTCVWKTIAILV